MSSGGGARQVGEHGGLLGGCPMAGEPSRASAASHMRALPVGCPTIHRVNGRRLRLGLVVLGALGFAWGIAHVALSLSSHHIDDRGLTAALGLLVGWSFIGTGLFAWWRRPANRTGLLMVAAGFSWFATELSVSDNDVLYTIGIFMDGFFAAV